jgi:transposase
MSGQIRVSLAPISSNTRIGCQLSKTDRNRIYGALDAGVRPSDVAARLNLNPNTVRTTKLRRPTRPLDGDVKPRSGRPRKLSGRDQRRLLRTIREEPKLTYSQVIKRLGFDISRSTYQRVLIRYNIRKWLAKKRPDLTEGLANNHFPGHAFT